MAKNTQSYETVSETQTLGYLNLKCVDKAGKAHSLGKFGFALKDDSKGAVALVKMLIENPNWLQENINRLQIQFNPVDKTGTDDIEF